MFIFQTSKAQQIRPKCHLAFLPAMGYNGENTFKEDSIMENEKIELYEEETSILTLTDENGADVEFEYLDCIEYMGKEYLVLMPVESESAEIVILEVEPVDEENENYLSVQNEEILNAVYHIFKEKYEDVLTFEEE